MSLSLQPEPVQPPPPLPRPGVLTADGHWNLECLSLLTRDDWREWIAARLHGRDARLPYEQDEYPARAAEAFVEMIRRHSDRCRQWKAFAEGIGAVLASMDPLHETPEALDGALEIAAHLAVRTDGAAETLKAWIDRELFLSGDRYLPHVHANALYALATLQRPGAAPDLPTCRKWLRPQQHRSAELRYRFIVPAFAGVAFGAKELPKDEFLALLDDSFQAEKEGVSVTLAPAILALFVRRDTIAVRSRLWEALRERSDARTLWERVSRTIGHTRFALPSYSEMESRRAPERVNLWEVQMRVPAAA